MFSFTPRKYLFASLIFDTSAASASFCYWRAWLFSGWSGLLWFSAERVKKGLAKAKRRGRRSCWEVRRAYRIIIK